MASLQVLSLAAALATAPRNRTANRTLAAMLVVFVGLLTPFTIGFAGFYDRWPWLSFAPFAVSLTVGPLLYGYTSALIAGGLPDRWRAHLAPGMAQFVYLCVCFALPLSIKGRWDDAVHTPYIDPAISFATLVSLAFYCGLSLRLLRRYRSTLGAVVSDERRYAALWLQRAIVAVIATLAVWCAYQAWEFVFGRLSYFDILGLYLVLGTLALYLGVEGWRHADLVVPAPHPRERVAAEPGKDWRALGQGWADRTRREGWWRDPDLSLPDLASRLGVNTTYLSRGLNEGLGVNFAGFVNGLRVDAVATDLAAGRGGDLLAMALEAGFNSKASFNRAFKAKLGVSPSVWRRDHGSKSQSSSPARN